MSSIEACRTASLLSISGAPCLPGRVCRSSERVSAVDDAQPGALARQHVKKAVPWFHPDWQEAADTTVAILHTEAGRDPRNRALTQAVRELATRSDAFRTRWAAHDVRLHLAGSKRFRHPVVGDLSVGLNATELPADPRLTLTVYTGEPSTASAEKLALLASWSASPSRAPAGASADKA